MAYEPRHHMPPTEPETRPVSGPVESAPQPGVPAAVRRWYRKGGRIRKAVIWTVAVFISLGVIGTLTENNQPAKPAQVVQTVQRVPNLYGFTQDDARRVLGMEGFTIGVVTPQKPGEVLWVRSQSPRPGTPVAPGTAISLSSLPGQPAAGR